MLITPNEAQRLTAVGAANVNRHNAKHVGATLVVALSLAVAPSLAIPPRANQGDHKGRPYPEILNPVL
jgi:hypothetical protein